MLVKVACFDELEVVSCYFERIEYFVELTVSSFFLLLQCNIRMSACRKIEHHILTHRELSLCERRYCCI